MADYDLQAQIESLEDSVFALMGAYGALVKALHETGIPLRELLQKNLARAANELEIDRDFPEPAAALDQLREVVDDLLRPESSRGKSTKGEP